MLLKHLMNYVHMLVVRGRTVTNGLSALWQIPAFVFILVFGFCLAVLS